MTLSRIASLTFLVRILSTGIGFLGLVSFIRILGPELYGSLVLFQGIISLVAVITSFGLDMAVEKRISGPETAPFLTTAVAMKLVLFVPCATLLWLFRASVDAYMEAPLTDVMIPALLTYMLGRTLLHSLRGELRVVEAETTRLLQRIVFVGVGVVVVLNGFGLRAVVWIFTFSWLFVIILLTYRSSSIHGLPDVDTVRSLFQYMRHSAIIVSLNGPVYSWADTLIIGLFLSPTAVTGYETAWRITRAIALLSTSVSTALFPQISNSMEKIDSEETREMISKGFVLSTLLVLPAMAGAIVVGPQLLAVVFDPALKMASTALVIIMIGRSFESLNDVVGPVLSGMEHPDLVARAALVQLVLGISLNLVLVPTLGITGGAIATAVSLATVTVIDIRYLERFIDVPLPTSTLAYSGFASALMAVAVYAVLQVLSGPPILQVVGAVVLGAVIYGVLISMNSEIARVVRSGLTG